MPEIELIKLSPVSSVAQENLNKKNDELMCDKNHIYVM